MNCTLLILAGLVAMAAAATIAPPLLGSSSAPDAMVNATVDDCDDDPTADCWNRPDKDCFGIYEPWSHQHCPLRCGFCLGKLPPCVDQLPYCDRFEDTTCTEDSYRIWARNNCRKHCNLCAVPTRPPGMCLYHGMDYKEGERWNDGCTYECSCINANLNLVVCTERCTRWNLSAQMTACKLVQEDNECCARMECN